MKNATILALAAIAALTGCSTASPRTSAAPPPFECTSIHPEICKLEEEFHKLRFEQAEQNAAIEAAELRRQERVQATASAATRSPPASGALLDAPSG